MIFDDVQFGIDVRICRVSHGWTQTQLAKQIGFANGISVSRLECATASDTLSLRRYMTICNVLGLNPMHYWDSIE